MSRIKLIICLLVLFLLLLSTVLFYRPPDSSSHLPTIAELILPLSDEQCSNFYDHVCNHHVVEQSPGPYSEVGKLSAILGSSPGSNEVSTHTSDIT